MDTASLKYQNIFADEREQLRLATQNRLMHECETPIFREIFAGKQGLNVLDVGSNNGEKTVRWFSDPAVGRVLGLEFSEPLALQAQAAYGDGRFRFCQSDADAEDFAKRLDALMAEQGIDAFDVVYLSFVLSHLRAPRRLLAHLRTRMRPGGTLVAVETNDPASFLTPDGGLLPEFLSMLSLDPYAGARSLGARLPGMLADSGFRAPVLRCAAIEAGPGEAEKKEMIFEMFFSYLPGDAALLRQIEPDDPRFARWEAWLDRNYAALRRSILAPESRISMGMSVVSCME